MCEEFVSRMRAKDGIGSDELAMAHQVTAICANADTVEEMALYRLAVATVGLWSVDDTGPAWLIARAELVEVQLDAAIADASPPGDPDGPESG
ncbi:MULTISPECIES: hypothetical protein [Mycobacterium]|uniref:hypothetical protein n=1 Tax=Mycobacterium TaxID=1763 RepID=UPI001EF11AC4|nr:MULTISPECIES: hypothetical protein [Mycobacterium]